ncbi:photosystem II D1 precursor processing protein PSB27-H2, chloroplastic [Asparagus officinalis]|nr:photosystem II D1 precursor processing protein PSB27-H2, chloroplastic [Asparagus officinalis]XP_020259717.1 photosystem II D1 precursor processing protein PSB27-H2, chloroplastic [Asparagus officinalis]
MVASSFLLLEGCCHWCASAQIVVGRHHRSLSKHKLQLRKPLVISESGQETSFSRRRAVLLCGGISLVSALTSSCVPVKAAAEEKSRRSQGAEEGETGAVGAIKSLFDPNEKTKSGKVLPKAYLKAAREVVKTLRESLEEDGKDVAKFRRSADAAKESIRDYLNGWRGQRAISQEESYVALEKAIRSLASFYSKAGPFAALSEEVKMSILDDLNTAEAYL